MTENEKRELIPCASVLKPLYVLIAKKETKKWDKNAKEIICNSDNHLTDILIESIGGLEKLTEKLNKLYGENIFQAPETWGRFLVNKEIITRLYNNALKDKDFTFVENLMREVTLNQRFGIPKDISMKAGWDLQEINKQWTLITHIVKIDSGVVTAESNSKIIFLGKVFEWHLELLENKENLPIFHYALMK